MQVTHMKSSFAKKKKKIAGRNNVKFRSQVSFECLYFFH